MDNRNPLAPLAPDDYAGSACTYGGNATGDPSDAK